VARTFLPVTFTASKEAVLFTCALGMFAGGMASFPIAVIMPTIAETFRVELPSAQWAMTGHFVALAATMLPVGSAGDIVGRSRIFVAGFGVLIVSLLATPLSSVSFDLFVFLRVLQGIGSGMVMVTAPAIVSAAFPPEERGRALGLTLLGGWVATGLGQPLFGALVESGAWYLPFLVAFVPSALALALSFKLPRVEPQTEQPFDPRGALLLMVGFGGFVVAAGHGQEAGWEFVHTLEHVGPLAALSVAALVVYGLHARREPHPILPLNLFRSPTLTTATTANGLAHMTMLMVGFLMPFYLQHVLGYSPLAVALFLVPMALMLNLMAFPSGWIYDRYGSRLPCSFAMVGGALLLFSFTGLTLTSGVWDVVLRLIGAGAVLGFFVTPNVSAILSAVPSQHYSLAAGLEQTSRNLGHALGTVLASSVASAVLASASAGATPDTYVHIVHAASGIAAALMALGSLLVVFRVEGTGNRVPPASVTLEEPEPTGSRA